MRTFEREIPGISESRSPNFEAPPAPRTKPLARSATASNGIQRQHSCVGGDETFGIYLAESEHTIRRHAGLSGIPITKITEVPQIIDPLTANN